MRTGIIIVFFGIVCIFCQPLLGQNQRARGLSRLLDTVQPDLKFTDVPLTDALDFIRDSNNINMTVDWKSLEAVNIDRNSLVNVHLHDVTLRKALTVILNEAGAGNVLTFYVQDNVLQITTLAKADSILYLKVYDVQDLLVTIPNFQLSDVTAIAGSLNSGGGGTQVGGTGGGGGTSLGGSTSTGSFGGNSSSASNSETPQQQGDDLVKLITDTVRPEVWKQNGGTATISFYHGMLIVNAPMSVLEAIGGPVD